MNISRHNEKAEAKKRSYVSETRDAQAAQTRSHILQAARELFAKEGFERVTIGRLAQAAAVSMPTVYAIFKSKRGVLQSLIDDALPPAQFAALVEEAMAEKSPLRHLRVSAKLARHIYDAERELMDILRGASLVAPELKELELERERRRYERQAQSVALLVQAGALAKGVTRQKARDILWALTGRDLYRLFVIERGWSSVAYEKWLAQQLAQALLRSELCAGG